MENKLQELTDKLYNEGLSKGKKEGEEILANARKEAADIVAAILPSVCMMRFRMSVGN